MDDSEIASKTIDVIGEIAPELYKDALQPTAKQIGKTLETGSKAVNMLLAPVSGMVWGYEKIKTYLEPILEEKLKIFIESKLKAPEPHIVVPAMVALSYSYKSDELREMYTNLIATSMVSDYSDLAHPSFVEIIKQLNPLDAQIFKEITSSSSGTPILKIRLATGPTHTANLKLELTPEGSTLFSPLAIFSSSQNSNYIATSLENLRRLNLIDISYSSQYTNQELYKPLEDHSFVQRCKSDYEKDDKYIYLVKGCIETNVFGRVFAHACLEPPSPTENS